MRRASVDAGRLAALRFATLRFGLGADDAFEQLAGTLAPASFAVLPLEAPAPDRAFAAIAVPASLRERLDSAVRAAGLEAVPLPADAASWNIASLDRWSEEAASRERQALDALDRLRTGADAAALADLARRADVAVLLLQAQTCFAAAGRFLVISGWIPAESGPVVSQAIAEASGGRAVVTLERPDDLPQAGAAALRVPILHRNPLLLRPFQGLVQLYGVPSYHEIQPVAFFALGFLLMFGLMFGDVGHGLVLFSAGYCLFRYLPRYLDYGILLMEGGVASAVFGLLYGSFFGVEGLLPVLWMEPIHDLPRFMAIAAAFGAAIVTLGIVLNIVNTWRLGERAGALLGRRGLLGAFLYWIVLALAVRALVPRSQVLPGWLLAALAVGAVALLVLHRPIVRWLGGNGRAHAPGPRWLVALEGSVELVDTLFSYFANTISFVRVAAFAAVHAGVFLAMFALADTLAETRFGTPLSIAALVVGNAVMILLEGLTVSVQVLRLEYYEFFEKFFRGGGEPYRPLMLRPSAGKDTP
jgi:V/A-type H+-transporting ATPase subunit I